MTEQECVLCGAIGDGEEGWAEDHKDVCLEAIVSCPSRAYGCQERMRRNQVAQHLAVCPASAVHCCYAMQGHAIHGFERWIFAQKPHIQMKWVCGKQVHDVVTDGVSCCDGPLRRCDLERHLLFAHADHNMVVQPCPFHAANQSARARGKPAGTYVEATPASPLFPTPKMGKDHLGRVPTRLPRLTKLRSPTSTSDEDRTSREPSRSPEPQAPSSHELSCSFVRAAVVPRFPRAGKITRGNAGAAAAAALGKADVLSRILGMLPGGMLPLLSCVARGVADAAADPALNARHKLLVFAWHREEQEEGREHEGAGGGRGRRVVWRERLEWVRPAVTVPLREWGVHVGAGAVGAHCEEGCSARGERATERELLVTAVRLHDATCPEGDVAWLLQGHTADNPECQCWAGGEFRFNGKCPVQRQRRRVEEEEEEEEEEVVEKLTSGPEVANWFAAVMREDTAAMALALRRNVDLNARNGGGYSALGLAEERGKGEAARWLKERGAARLMPRRANYDAMMFR